MDCFWDQFLHPKMVQNGSQNEGKIWENLVLGAWGGRCATAEPPKAPRRPPGHSKWSQREPQSSQNATQMTPKTSKNGAQGNLRAAKIDTLATAGHMKPSVRSRLSQRDHHSSQTPAQNTSRSFKMETKGPRAAKKNILAARCQ